MWPTYGNNLFCRCRHETDATAATAAAKSLQSCPTLCDPIDGSPPGSSVPGILQARTLEWVAISLSNACKWKVKVKSLSRAQLLATPWTAAHQAPPSMGFSRQEYWSGLALPSPKSDARKIHISFKERLPMYKPQLLSIIVVHVCLCICAFFWTAWTNNSCMFSLPQQNNYICT